MCINGTLYMFERAQDFRVRRLTTICATGMVAATLCMTNGEAAATIAVDGKSNAVSLTVDEAPINEVLAALSAKFDLTYTPTPGLQRIVGGSYSGTLQEVLERILDGCDYVVSYSGDKIELKILESSRPTAHASSPPPSLAPAGGAANAPPKGPVSASAGH